MFLCRVKKVRMTATHNTSRPVRTFSRTRPLNLSGTRAVNRNACHALSLDHSEPFSNARYASLPTGRDFDTAHRDALLHDEPFQFRQHPPYARSNWCMIMGFPPAICLLSGMCPRQAVPLVVYRADIGRGVVLAPFALGADAG